MSTSFSRRFISNSRRYKAGARVFSALWLGGALASGAFAQADGGMPKFHGSASTAALYQFPGAPNITVSTHGNILKIQTSPGAGGASHIFSEGYILCYGGAQAYDRAFNEAGFAPPTTASCSGSTCTFIRKTVDNIFQLKQVITKNSPEERSINVEMTLTNLLGGPVSGIILRRYADFDVDAYGTGTANTINWWGASEFDSVYAWNAATNHAGPDSAMLMRHLKRTPNTIPYGGKVTAWNDNECNPFNLASGSWAQGDYAATVQYNVGTLGGHQSAIVKVQYQRN